MRVTKKAIRARRHKKVMRASAHHKTSNECECAPEKNSNACQNKKKQQCVSVYVTEKKKKCEGTPQIKVVRVSARHNK